MASQFLALLLLSRLLGAALGWQNDYDQVHKYECPSGQSLYRIQSIHSNHYEDRRWQWTCRDDPALVGVNLCSWLMNVNEWDGVLNWSCPKNYPIVAGTTSDHDNFREDRRFSYKCCRGSVPHAYTCRRVQCLTTNTINTYDSEMDYSAPEGYHVDGFYSQHDNHYEDRMWQVKICKTSCVCEPGFASQFCATDVDECESAPCKNGASCYDKVNDFACSCRPGFSGKDCGVFVDDCANTPCRNGGTCTDLVNNFVCTCPAGFEGYTCDTNVDDCAKKPCLNGGTCVDRVNDFNCFCLAGFGGKDCSYRCNSGC